VLTDHEYGAVQRIWQRACQRAGAAVPITAALPVPIDSAHDVVEAILAKVTARTRLIVVSHITSPTAIILPVSDICQAAHQRNVAVCVDGPHAVAQLPLDLDRLQCDYYTASCHKWLCAPFGSGFLYVHPRHQASIQSPIVSWGRLLPATPTRWTDEFIWTGTRNPAAMLAIPAAVDFMQAVGLPAFRTATHQLARYARHQLARLTDLEPLVPDSPQWYASMAQVPLPPGDAVDLQRKLWEQYRIEVPIVSWRERRFARVSCHLYTEQAHIDRLVDALRTLLKDETA
jgi:isopenicillin-N epimerase